MFPKKEIDHPKPNRIKRFLLRASLTLFLFYTIICIFVYLQQEQLLFHPTKLSQNHMYAFDTPFKELNVSTTDGKQLNGLLFKGDSTATKLVFFLHGNTGNLENQNGVAAFYTSLGYDFFSFDYRGFGKSTGSNDNEQQFYEDASLFYHHLLQTYDEKNCIIIGYSVGTATAAYLASTEHPQQLILMAPYYSMVDMAANRYPYIPSFLVAYRFETFRFIPQIDCPITLFHGKEDEAIPFSSSKRLAGLLKKKDHFFPLIGKGHEGIEKHLVFQEEINKLLQPTD